MRTTDNVRGFSKDNIQVEHLTKLAKQLHESLVIPIKIKKIMDKMRRGESIGKNDPYAFWYKGKIIYPYIELYSK